MRRSAAAAQQLQIRRHDNNIKLKFLFKKRNHLDCLEVGRAGGNTADMSGGVAVDEASVCDHCHARRGDLNMAMTVAVAVTLVIAIAGLLCRCGGGHDHGLRSVVMIVGTASAVTACHDYD